MLATVATIARQARALPDAEKAPRLPLLTIQAMDGTVDP
jgi:hypothetical protein